MKYLRTIFGITIFTFLVSQNNTYANDLSQTVKGTITDAQSKAPIIGASVVILNTDPLKGSITDIDGSFKIDDVPLGRHIIKISYIGYEDRIIPEVLVGSGKEVVLNATLTESIVKMDEIVISAAEQSKGKTINELASVSAQSFSTEETSRYAATFDDPARAALSFAGVSGGGDDLTNEIVIRGNSPKGLLWRMEGIEIPNPNHFSEQGSSAGGISMLSSSMLANSDFFTGAFPSEYGNALSGVFDLHLRQGNSDKREYAFQAGFLGLALAAEGPFSKNSKASYLINYRYSTLAFFDKIGINIVGENESIVFQDLSFKLHFPTEKAGSFSLWGLGGASSSIEDAVPEEESYYNDDFRTDMNIVGLSHNYFFNNSTFLDTKLSFANTRNRYTSDSLGIFTEDREKFSNSYARASLLLNKKLNAKNTLRFGSIYSSLGYDLFSSEIASLGAPEEVAVDDNGRTGFIQAYGQWQYRLNERLTLNSGVHFSQLALNNSNSLEPRFGMKYKLSGKSSINAGYGIHSRIEAISIYLLKDDEGKQSNKSLDLTKAAHYIVGYETYLRKNLRLKTEAYYQDLYDVPVLLDTDPNVLTRNDAYSLLNEKDAYVPGKMINTGTGSNYGIEVTIEKHFTNNHYFTVTGSLYDSKYIGGDGKERNTVFNSNFIANALGGKEIKVGRSKQNILGLNGRIIWSGGNRTTPIDLAASRAAGRTQYAIDDSADNNIFSTRLPDYMRIDFGIKYRKNTPKASFIWSLNIQNLTGRVNVADEYYSSEDGRIMQEEQLSTFPNFSYRIEF